MKDKEEFFKILSEIDGLDAGEYARIIGDFDFGRFVLKINRVHAEDEAHANLFIVRVPQQVAGFPPHLTNTPVRRTALEDLLSRRLAQCVDRATAFDSTGVARRRISIAAGGQKILPRSSLLITDENVEARMYIDLPQVGGRVAGDAAKEVFFEELPTLVTQALIHCNLNAREVDHFVDTMEDADQLRQTLPTRGFVAFVGEGSMLARRGDTDLPDYEHEQAVQVAEEIRVQVDVPNAGAIRGLGIPTGVTVILGRDRASRIELLRGIAAGIYNHVPGDGREFTITLPDAVYIASDAGRSVQSVDISSFLSGDAAQRGPTTVQTADPVTAQAASLIEALEVGARALILDESDSAPGFLTRDSRLAGLIGSSETVPLVARARQLADELGVSIIVGGDMAVAEFIPVADTVLLVDHGAIRNITREAKQLGVQALAPAAETVDIAKATDRARWVIPSSIDASHGRHDAVIHATSLQRLTFGRATIDLSSVRQLADIHQTNTIGLILNYARNRYLDEGRPIREIMDLVDRDLSTEGLESLSRDLRGDLARPRRYEIAAALNRLSTLRISHAAE